MGEIIVECCGKPESQCQCDMRTRQEKLSVTKTINQISKILEEVSANPDDYDLTKASVELYELVLASLREDLEIASNMKSFWVESASGAER